MSLLDRMSVRVAQSLDPETAHNAAVAMLRTLPFGAPPAPLPRLAQLVAGLDFANPVGLAAGFDKNAEVPDALLARGFGFVEVGTITPRPQAGNARPRLFRLTAEHALINRFGFNNDGVEICRGRLLARGRRGIVGVNIGANKDSDNRIDDYVIGIEYLLPVADYFTVNISSPNTPGLRSLQSADALGELVSAVMEARATHGAPIGRRPPIFVKIAPDLTDAELDAIAEVAISSGVDGLIVSNTTLGRPVAQTAPHRGEAGGLSGAPLFERSTIILARMRQRVGPAMVLIGVGGIDSAESALAKIEAGAHLVQLYSAMAFNGLGLASRIVRDLDALCAARGISHISSLRGTQSEQWASRPLKD